MVPFLRVPSRIEDRPGVGDMGCVARLDYFWGCGNWAEAGAMRCSIVTWWNCLSGGSE